MPSVIPVYAICSHGGSGGPAPSSPGVAPGNVLGNGAPIYVGYYGNENCSYPIMDIFVTGGNATVQVQGNSFQLVSAGTPDPTTWVDYSAGGFILGPTTTKSLALVVLKPFWRTVIVALDAGASVLSFVGAMRVGGEWMAPAHIPTSLEPVLR